MLFICDQSSMNHHSVCLIVGKKIKMFRSKVWQHFKKLEKNEEASCNYCDAVLKHAGSTTCLWNHYNFKHKLSNGVDSMQESSRAYLSIEIDDNNRILPPKRKRTSRVSASINNFNDISQGRQELITQALTKMLTVDLLPTSFVENEGFRSFINILEPGYKVPCRKTMRKRIEALYSDELIKVQNTINKVETSIALTTDGWTSRSLDSYVTITGIEMKIKEILITLQLKLIKIKNNKNY